MSPFPTATSCFILIQNTWHENKTNLNVQDYLPMVPTSDTSSLWYESTDARCMMHSCFAGILTALLLILCVRALPNSKRLFAPADAHAPLEHLAACMLATQLISFIAYTLPILDSLELSLRLGNDAAFSGEFVGLYMTGVACGSSCMWLMCRCRQTLGTTWLKLMHAVGLAFIATDSLVHGWVVCVQKLWVFISCRPVASCQDHWGVWRWLEWTN